MHKTFLDVLQYAGAGGAVVAALIVSLDISRRWTGIGFVIFVCSSIALIGWGFLEGNAEGIGYQNVVLLIINSIGVYRYLLAKRPPRTASD